MLPAIRLSACAAQEAQKSVWISWARESATGEAFARGRFHEFEPLFFGCTHPTQHRQPPTHQNRRSDHAGVVSNHGSTFRRSEVVGLPSGTVSCGPTCLVLPRASGARSGNIKLLRTSMRSTGV